MRFLQPAALLLLIPFAAAAAAAIWRPGGGKLALPAGERLRARGPGLRARAARLASPLLQGLALCLIAAALARPQTYRTTTRVVDSVDVMIVFDLSKSMEEADMSPLFFQYYYP